MGAQQSSQDGAAPANGSTGVALPRKTCYYELLGVERSADDAEIRKAYKKKALELHPDRNFNDEENATRKFAEVQTAYEIISDPQERAWYDSHREAILRGDDGDGDGDGAPERHYNVRITTTDEIMTLIGRFNSRVPFNDSPSGFYGILDVTFGQLATEEAAACDWDGQDPVHYPPFGAAGDGHDDTAKPFYAAWSNFTTKKSFAWKDKWRLSDAPDRRVRRLMEKENKKLRDDAVRDFNDAVRSLVAFVKKRDPRYKPTSQSEADRQKVLRDSAATQAARARAANLEKLRQAEVAEWAQSRGDDDAEYNDEFATSEEDSEVECFECVVCNKVFKSEKQYEVHEKSKKHVKAVQQLRRQMRKEGHDLELDVDGSAAVADASPDQDSPVEEAVTQKDEPRSVVTTDDGDTCDLAGEELLSYSDDPLDDEYAPREAVEDRLASDQQAGLAKLGDDEEMASKMTETTLADEVAAPKKMGSAKAKRAKKAAQAQGQETSVCYSTWSERGDQSTDHACYTDEVQCVRGGLPLPYQTIQAHQRRRSRAAAGSQKGDQQGQEIQEMKS